MVSDIASVILAVEFASAVEEDAPVAGGEEEEEEEEGREAPELVATRLDGVEGEEEGAVGKTELDCETEDSTQRSSAAAVAVMLELGIAEEAKVAEAVSF